MGDMHDIAKLKDKFVKQAPKTPTYKIGESLGKELGKKLKGL